MVEVDVSGGGKLGKGRGGAKDLNDVEGGLHQELEPEGFPARRPIHLPAPWRPEGGAWGAATQKFHKLREKCEKQV